MTERRPTASWKDPAAADLVDCARHAEDAIRRLAQMTRQELAFTPAEVDTVLSHLAETVAALPQVAGQLSDILTRTRDTHLFAMDGMTATTDLAIDTAQHHLDEARHPAVETYRHLNAARNEVAYISVIHDLEDDPPPEHSTPVARRHRPEERHPPALGHDHGPGHRCAPAMSCS